MEKIVKLSPKEFNKLFNKLKGNIRVNMDDIGIHWTDTEEELKEKIHKAFNPDEPMFINMYDVDGVTTYVKTIV